MRVTCPSSVTLLDLITLIILGGVQIMKLHIALFSAASCYLSADFLLIILFSNIWSEVDVNALGQYRPVSGLICNIWVKSVGLLSVFRTIFPPLLLRLTDLYVLCNMLPILVYGFVALFVTSYLTSWFRFRSPLYFCCGLTIASTVLSARGSLRSQLASQLVPNARAC
jgi:hypothetical protein